MHALMESTTASRSAVSKCTSGKISDSVDDAWPIRFSTLSQYSGSDVYWSQAITAHDVRGTSSLGSKIVGTWSAASGNSVCISLSYQRLRPAHKLWKNDLWFLKLGMPALFMLEHNPTIVAILFQQSNRIG